MRHFYYDTERRYLREAGRAFAEAFPTEARHLNLDSLDDCDPFVERLFSGFALLAGRIHERLDDEMPQYTEGLLKLICPHFLNPFPSCCILQLDPEPGLVQDTTRLAAGLEVRSTPVGPEQTTCRFRTTETIQIQPLRLGEAIFRDAGTDRSILSLRFHLDRGVALNRLDLDRLRLYLHADGSDATALYRSLTRSVQRVRLNTGSRTVDLLGQKWVQPVGFRREERLLPGEAGTFSGLQMLQEYFCFQPRFWFVELLGLDRHPNEPGATSLRVDLHIDRPAPPKSGFSAETLRLHCVPAVNLFERDAEPIRVDGRAAEYRVVPDVRSPEHTLAYDVREITGIEEKTGRRHTYRPFYTFAHGAWPAPSSASGTGGSPGPSLSTRPPPSHRDHHGTDRHFTTVRRRTPHGRTDLYLSLGGTELPSIERGGGETLSLTIRATNGSLPRETLSTDAVTVLAPGTPQIIRPTNVTRPTAWCPAPDRDRFQWSLLSHLAFNLQSVTSREALCRLLHLYDWKSANRRTSNRKQVDAIRTVSWTPTTSLLDGAVVRGLTVHIEVDNRGFSSEGDLCLFGEVLSRFLTAYATINTCVELTLTTRPSGRAYSWTPSAGDRLPL